MTDALTPDEETHVVAVALDWALKDAGTEGSAHAALESGHAVSVVLHLHRITHPSGEETGLLCGSAEAVETRAASIAKALAEDGVRCSVEVRDPKVRMLALHLTTPNDAEALTRWIVAGLPPLQAAARRLRRALAAIGAPARPSVRHERIEAGSLDPTDTAYLCRALGAAPSVDADGMAEMDPDELEALARDLSTHLRRTAKVRMVIDPEPGCHHAANRLRMGSLSEKHAHRLATYLETRATLPLAPKGTFR